MSSTNWSSLLDGIRIDLSRLHRTWMELRYPRQLDPGPVLERYRPSTLLGNLLYWSWALLGLPLVLVGYPLLLVGVCVRFQAHHIDNATTRLGLVGTLILSLLGWGALSAVAHFRFSWSGFLAVIAASAVATVAALLAVTASFRGGRRTTALIGYPAGITALFLPPIVAALYSPTLAAVVFPNSESLAIWLLDTLLTVGDLNTLIRATFDLEGLAYVGMWLGISVPCGWLLGGIVALADLIRPR